MLKRWNPTTQAYDILEPENEKEKLMAAKFSLGQQVRQVMPAPLVGTVKAFALDSTTGTIHVHFQTEDGQERVLKEDDLEAATPGA